MLSFLFPALLAAFVSVPVIWWLLRVMPPMPRLLRFPGMMLLKDLSLKQTSPAKTPWWLLLLRALILSLIILGLAQPVLNKADMVLSGSGTVLLVVDNSWAAAESWSQRIEKIQIVLAKARDEGRPVAMLPTAARAETGDVRLLGPMPAQEAESRLRSLFPQPWEKDYTQTLKVLEETDVLEKTGAVWWFQDGLGQQDGDALLQKLSGNAAVSVVADDKTNNPCILAKENDGSGFAVRCLRVAGNDITHTIQAYTANGHLLDRYSVIMPTGSDVVRFQPNITTKVRNSIARFTLQGEPAAASVWLMDETWRRRPVGLIAVPGENNDYLSDVFYLRRAMETLASVSEGSVDELLSMSQSVIFWAESVQLTEMERMQLANWVEGGGMLVRFAGPSLGDGVQDNLLPVQLRYGSRAMEGVMTWAEPLQLGKPPENSPFAGIHIADDIVVRQQVLANPTPDLPARTWLTLEDGTPLVTHKKSGDGQIVLIHTTAGPKWSSFCLSGTYVEVMRRLILKSVGVSAPKPGTALPPVRVMDGLGTLQTPAGIVQAVSLKDTEKRPSPFTPPGLYGKQGSLYAYNLSDKIDNRMTPVVYQSQQGVLESYQTEDSRLDLRSVCLLAAFVLFLLDMIVTIVLQGGGLIKRKRVKSTIFIFAFMLLISPETAQAQDYTNGIYLGYIKTGDRSVDEISQKGLEGLARVLRQRTAVEVDGVVGLEPAQDDLVFFPFIYWPMTQTQAPLSVEAAYKIRNYISTGGLILFDTRDRMFGEAEGQTVTLGTEQLRRLTAGLSMPALMRIPDDHVLGRTFYLLNRFPGRYAGGDLWIEESANPNFDSVPSVIIGSHDWAAAWLWSPEGRARYDIVPGGERQREYAYRAGVNMVMMALTGSYKADQVHIKHILERLQE